MIYILYRGNICFNKEKRTINKTITNFIYYSYFYTLNVVNHPCYPYLWLIIRKVAEYSLDSLFGLFTPTNFCFTGLLGFTSEDFCHA